MSKQIQWFPGHMAKARREISEKIKLIDIIIELVDARAPKSSKNPMFDDICQNKPRLIVMTKKDLADEKLTQKWLQYYQSKGMYALSVNLKNFNEYQLVINTCKEILKEKMEKEAKRGLKPRAMRAMVLGIPNVGKSTFINRLAKRKATVTGNRPGVTKAQQIIRVDKDFELFDTPGVLWPKFDDLDTARNIALIGSIKQDILPLDELFIYAVEYLQKNYDNVISKRYNVEIDFDSDWVEKVYDDIAKNRKIKPIRGYTDYDRVMEIFFNDIFNGELGKITWELPDETL
ncbi:ribosome biogenesis GTPase YlqF [Erysipelatoclostridium sp. An15]|uniref:ribosome biogenesis GTPase YlqF n=1 Tax=unclassified Thomasclavelia TaxID=3025756 RepID=UPI000B37DBDA|nr:MULTISPECIES: ribosome biogenesis GTPase YlqF [unclassified Thomasclavelia]OUP79089.1 ribosome biogenesis GTPase YlqF [Erysipelatoclostridium sp. An173]OUQ09287.1 ribosome biogenesis GTPase YlqF [Erysipelatoclostridium sp. An15]